MNKNMLQSNNCRIVSKQAVGYDISAYPHVVKWFAKVKTSLPGYDEANQKGVDAFKALYESTKK